MRWRRSKKAFGWLWRAFGAVSTIIGVSGLPDNVHTWARWIDVAVNDPFVVKLAQQAVLIAEFVNQRWVRIGLVIGGCLLLIWPFRWFWRLRHRVVFLWRSYLEGEVWINGRTAYDLVRTSDWAKAREPVTSFTDTIARTLATGVNPHEKKFRKFGHFIKMTLESFADQNPTYVRKAESGDIEYREDKLRKFLSHAYDEDVKAEFGDIPRSRV